MGRRIPLAAVAIMIGAIAPAAAQFGSIFGEPPRPPTAVPGARQQTPPPTYPPQNQYPPPAQNQYPPGSSYPSGSYPPPANAPGPYGGVQSRPLPPPQGAPVVTDPAPRDPAARAPVARQRGPVDTSPQPGDEVI